MNTHKFNPGDIIVDTMYNHKIATIATVIDDTGMKPVYTFKDGSTHFCSYIDHFFILAYSPEGIWLRL